MLALTAPRFTSTGTPSRCPAQGPSQRLLERLHPARHPSGRGEVPRPLCQACPVRNQCTTTSRGGRQRTFRPRQVQQALDDARAEQTTDAFKAKYALRAGVEGTIHQAIAVADMRHARYRGLEKVHLQHVYAAVALNLLRLDAWWNGHPLDRTRTSHLARLELALAA